MGEAFKDSLREIEKLDSFQVIPELYTPPEVFWQESLERVETYRNDLRQKLNMGSTPVPLVPVAIDEEKSKEADISIEDLLDSCFKVKKKKKKCRSRKRLLSDSLPKPKTPTSPQKKKAN